jgi:hypothetical protein
VPWVDDASIQIKAVTGAGDPVDLGTEEVREVIAGLSRLLQEVASRLSRRRSLGSAGRIQPLHPFTVDLEALRIEGEHHLPTAEKQALEVQLIERSHQLHLADADRHGLVGPAQALAACRGT